MVTKDKNATLAAEPIVVSPSANILDTITAAARYLAVIIAAVPTIRLLLGAHDFAGLVAYFQSGDGKAVAAAAVAVGSIAYGLYKTHKRGAQVVTVAASPDVPDGVAHFKR